jgi:membrane protein YqaA with SNARE-associated domain
VVSEAGRPAPHEICHRNVGFLSHLVVRNGACRAIGVFLLDLVRRKVGKKGLKRLVKPRLLEIFKGAIQNHAAVALVISCLAPPPFPFEASIAGASAFQYPRLRLLVLVFVARAFRYSLVGWAATYFES